MSSQFCRIPDVSHVPGIGVGATVRKRDASKRRRERRQQQYLENLGKDYQPARHGWRVALKWQWSTIKCKECGEVRYRRMVLCWSYAKKRPAGGWIVISRPAGQLRKNTKLPAPGPGPEIKCSCPGKRGPRPALLKQAKFLKAPHTRYQGIKIGTELLASPVANDPAREMIMDIANQPAGDLVIGVAECPACGGELMRDQIKQALQDPMGIPTGKVRVHRVHKCKCGWCVSFQPSDWSNYRSIDILVVSQPGIELPVCGRGHSLAWSKQRRVGNRLDVQCVQFQVDRLLQCNDIRSIWIGGVPSGFLSKPGTYNATKAVVLQCLWQYQERGLTFAELRSQTGLSDGQLLGYLKRATSAKIQLIEKVDEVFQPPNKMVALYKITPAGTQWVSWAVDQGYYVEV